MTDKASYHETLKALLDEYAHLVYRVTRSFPREELYGITSQLRRASLSVVLNYIEGYARFKTKVHKNFLETSYGSLKESMYLLDFSLKEGYITEEDFKKANVLAERAGAMLFGILRRIQNTSSERYTLHATRYTKKAGEIEYCLRNARAIFQFMPPEFDDNVFVELKAWMQKHSQ